MSGRDATRAYATCVAITRRRAGNFFYGIRLLPPDKRRAMCAIYALARRIDDIGDGDLPRGEKLARLGTVRAELRGLDRHQGDPVLAAVQDAWQRFELPLDAFDDLVAGVEMDAVGARFERFEELELYCRRVAGSIGRLSLAVFGTHDRAAAIPLADDLGVALQLTNILRDVREDRELGRVYLPAEDLRRFGCAGDLEEASPAAREQLIRFEAERDREWFDRGLRLLPLLDRRSASCVAAMSGIYRRVLERIEQHPDEVLRRRVSLTPWEKGWVAMHSLAGAR
jgi:phytoene synthase